MTVLELLSDPTAERWVKGTYGPMGVDLSKEVHPSCCWCLSGAILAVYQDSYPVLVRVARHLRLLAPDAEDLEFGGGGSRIEEWNDAPERTKEDVLAVCRELGI
jgi:hypothetical protein